VEFLADGDSAAPVTQPARAQVTKSVAIDAMAVAETAHAERTDGDLSFMARS
jgi:hypothetical protein